MGMYTTVLFEQGEVQFKTGYDYCDTYRIGSEIEFDPSSWTPGAWIDGAYIGYDRDNQQVIARVAIKGHKIIAVETDPTSTCEEIVKKYGIQTTAPRGLWTEEEWAEKERLDAEAKKRWEASLDKCGGDFRAAFLDTLMSEESVLNKLLPATSDTSDKT